MKLNYKRTILVGFAFFLISAFWQAYDSTISLLLTNKFGMSQTWSGVIMALDNILALFMLPLFGALSDKHTGKSGRRTPFIRFGTIVAAIVFVLLSFVDGAQLKQLGEITVIDDPNALSVIYDAQADAELMTPEGDKFILSEVITKQDFVQIRSNDVITVQDAQTGEEKQLPSLYTRYVVPARQACAAEITANNPTPLILFVALLLIVLVAMATFRSPAVALMPDVTMKPLRSKANAVINLMGTAGGILVLVLGIVFGTSSVKNAMMRYTAFYSVIAIIMLGALVAFLYGVKEKKWAAEMQADSIRYGIEEKVADGAGNTRRLNKSEITSLILILASIALWYFGYNAITSKYSVYAPNVLQKDYNTTMLIAQGTAIVAYLPAGIIATKIGRKKTILIGVAMLASAFGAAAFMRESSPGWLMNIMFAVAGAAWATINVNSFPMVVELCTGADVGKYTGFYYTASMAAQTVTPMLSGFLMDKMGLTVLFPYAAVFAALAFITMLFVKHGDTVNVVVPKGIEIFDNEE